MLCHVDTGPCLNRRGAVDFNQRRFDACYLPGIVVFGEGFENDADRKTGHGGGNVKFLDPEADLGDTDICQADDGSSRDGIALLNVD